MGVMPKGSPQKKLESSKKSMIVIVSIIGGIAIAGVGYMMIFVEPELIVERVKVIAVTKDGCIAETFDGFAVNIGQCNVQPGDFIIAHVDQKIKDRAKAMNPT
jgi:flagellar basal body-associated protein FliL